jgi:hypothetical protein
MLRALRHQNAERVVQETEAETTRRVRMASLSRSEMGKEDMNSHACVPLRAGTFSLTGPTPSLSLLGDDGEYLIRTSVRKRCVPPLTPYHSPSPAHTHEHT